MLAALYARERSGRGQRVDVSLLGGQVWSQASEITHYLLSGHLPGRANRGHPHVGGVWRVFATEDGHITIAGARAPLWAGLCRAIERPDLIDDPRFTGASVSEAEWQELYAILDGIFRTRSTDDWCARLRAESQRYAPLRDYAQVADDPQVGRTAIWSSWSTRTGAALRRLAVRSASARRRRSPAGLRPNSASTRKRYCWRPALPGQRSRSCANRARGSRRRQGIRPQGRILHNCSTAI